ncbi:MAG: hypothetical protein AB1453_03860 [Chloroflexota bacterium]
MIELSTLMERLMEAVPPRRNVPGAEQYQAALFDAVEAASQAMPRTKIATLTIQAGQATYDLPADFLALTRIATPFLANGVLVAAEGIVPLGSAGRWSERYTINAGKITFYPMPNYSTTREITYTAKHVLDSEDCYAEMSRLEASAVLMHAQAACLILQANAAAQEAWTYQLGEERVSKERLAAELREQARELERRFQTTADQVNGGTTYQTAG